MKKASPEMKNLSSPSYPATPNTPFPPPLPPPCTGIIRGLNARKMAEDALRAVGIGRNRLARSIRRARDPRTVPPSSRSLFFHA